MIVTETLNNIIGVIIDDSPCTGQYRYMARFCIWTSAENQVLSRLVGKTIEELINMLDSLFGDNWYDRDMQNTFKQAVNAIRNAGKADMEEACLHQAIVTIAELSDPHNEFGQTKF